MSNTINLETLTYDEMFEDNTVPNDLKLVNDKINAYYKGGK